MLTEKQITLLKRTLAMNKSKAMHGAINRIVVPSDSEDAKELRHMANLNLVQHTTTLGSCEVFKATRKGCEAAGIHTFGMRRAVGRG